MSYSAIIANRIRQLCRKRQISVNHLANMSGLNQSTLDNIVRGLTKNPRIITLHRIALAFGLTVAEFLDIDELNNFVFEEDDEVNHTA